MAPSVRQVCPKEPKILAAATYRFLALDAPLHPVLPAEWLCDEHRHYSMRIPRRRLGCRPSHSGVRRVSPTATFTVSVRAKKMQTTWSQARQEGTWRGAEVERIFRRVTIHRIAGGSAVPTPYL